MKPKPKTTSEDSGLRNDYYNKKINRAADDYLNEWGGKDTAEAKAAWAAYGEQVDELVEQRDAYNRAAMGVDTAAGDEQAPGENDTPITPTQGILNDMFNAGGEGAPESVESGDEALGSYLDDMFNDGGEWNLDEEEETGQEGFLTIGDKEYPILNNIDALDQMEVIDSYTITREEFDTAGFILGAPGYLSDSPGPLMIIETIANFAKGANDSLGRTSVRIDIINDDGVEKAVYALELKSHPLASLYYNARRTKVDDEGTRIFEHNDWGDWREYHIDKGHTSDNTLAYFYVDNGILMCQINILPNDKFLISENAGPPEFEDVTYLYSQPFEYGTQE